MSEEPRKPLTRAQRRVYDFIVSFIRKRQYPPTLREIGRALKIRSTNAVSEHLAMLERKGYIDAAPNTARGIRIKVVDIEGEAAAGGVATLDEALAIIRSLEGVALTEDPTSPLVTVLRLARGYVALSKQTRETPLVDVGDMVKRYARGETCESIAKPYRRTARWALRVLTKAGAKIRPRGRPHKASDETLARRAEVAARYERGETMEEIAHAYDRSLTWARQVLLAAGVKRRPRGRRRTSDTREAAPVSAAA